MSEEATTAPNTVADINKKKQKPETNSKSKSKFKKGGGASTGRAQGGRAYEQNRKPKPERFHKGKKGHIKQVSILGARRVDDQNKFRSSKGTVQILRKETNTARPQTLRSEDFTKPSVVPSKTLLCSESRDVLSEFATEEQGKIITEAFEFADSVFTKTVSANTQFQVVAVLGLQGVGKTSYLIQLIKSLVPKNELGEKHIFQVQTNEDKLKMQHRTKGIDGYFVQTATEKFLLLDTEPVLSPSICAELVDNETPIPSGLGTYMEAATLRSLQLIVFLLTVCHSVVIMQENYPSSNENKNSSIELTLWRLLRMALLIKTKSIVSNGDHTADMLLATENPKIVQAWKRYFSDIIPDNCESRPRLDVIGLETDSYVTLLRYCSDTFDARSDKQGHIPEHADPDGTTALKGTRNPSEQDWFNFSRGLWHDLKETNALDDFKSILRETGINIL